MGIVLLQPKRRATPRTWSQFLLPVISSAARLMSGHGSPQSSAAVWAELCQHLQCWKRVSSMSLGSLGWMHRHGKVAAPLLPQLLAAVGRDGCCSVSPYLDNEAAGGELHRFHPGFIRAAREIGTAAAITRMAYQGSERR